MRFMHSEPRAANAARKKQGQEGEARAANLLRQQGFEIVERNYATKFGEVDLIAEKEDLLVFVEVRSRASDWFSSPLHTIDRQKQRKVVLSAMDYLARRRVQGRRIRFDVVSIAAGSLQHIEDAFDAGR